MPLKFFRCPTGTTVEVESCLEQCANLKGRCLAEAHLVRIARGQREYTGTSSVTQLIKPTRLAYLEITKDYAVLPDDMAFMLYGNLMHARLEYINKRLDGLAEKTIKGDINGTLDRLEKDELQPGFFKLIDYKLVGAYSIARALGIDRKGNGTDPDMAEWELQLNKYRLLLESDPQLSKMFPISRMLIQATVRDSGLKEIRVLGLPCRMPMIPVKRLDDNFVAEYFLTKDYLLHKHLKEGTLPPMCAYEGRWRGNRCQAAYCEVHPFCPEGAKINRVPFREV